MLKHVNFRNTHVTLCKQHVRDLKQSIKSEFNIHVNFKRKSIFELFQQKSIVLIGQTEVHSFHWLLNTY